jgi:uncharacterized damage-inducible protein DinB
MEDQSRLKELLLEQFTQQNAHVVFDKAVDGLALNDVGVRPEKLPHSIWELAEHIRIAQHDILDFSQNPNYQGLNWPDDYWPSSARPEDQQAWDASKESFHQDKNEMEEFVRQTDLDLMKPLAHGNGQTLFREILLIIDHNAYHIGQIVQVRRLLGSWK